MFLCTGRGQDFAELENGRQVEGNKIKSLGERWQGAIAVLLFLDWSAVAVLWLDVAIGL